MPRRLRSKLPRDHRLLRLETLLRLRWYAVIVQAILILVGQFPVGLDLPLGSIGLVLAFAVALNMALQDIRAQKHESGRFLHAITGRGAHMQRHVQRHREGEHSPMLPKGRSSPTGN